MTGSEAVGEGSCACATATMQPELSQTRRQVRQAVESPSLAGRCDGPCVGTPALELRRVTFRRGDTAILGGVTWRARVGERWALLGPNGAGKSTLLSFCGPLAHPTSGTVDVLGHRLGRVDLQELRRSIGHVNPRHPVQGPLTVEQVFLTGLTGSAATRQRWAPSNRKSERARELIAQIGMSHRTSATWTNLSQGERTRTLIARALMPEPRLLLLDEPTTGLDVAAREQLLETIDTLQVSAPDLTSVLVTHHLEKLPVTTSHAMLLSSGQVTASGPVETVLTTDRVTQTFKHPIAVHRADGRWSARATPPHAIHS